MPVPCPTRNSKYTKNEFYIECAQNTFETFHKKFDRVEGEYLDYIKNINDPILRHIFLYFIQYYIDGYYYFKDSDQGFRDTACSYLRYWLQEKKDLFTYGERCQTKKGLWEEKIKILLDTLKKNHTLTKTIENKPWCDHFTLSLTSEYPGTLPSPKCEERFSQESSITYPPPQPVKTECECAKIEDSVIPLQPVQPQETDPTKNLAVTSGFTAVGTLGTLFFLYRFTPMMSWFRRPGMNNIGTDLYMNPGGAESFLSMQQDNGSNNLFYQP
ncbi:unnamed protein product [Plasmodium vivax]|uniref:(malaria parasite P. vivax) hypothetical protein n=1 Tax=Plasmodium vivax TaxID=5855 RepID=A0A8S4HNE4_PLAVI|nr:unnamed protein product [Plasmodium vivax]